MNLREELITIFTKQGIICKELELKPFRNTVWMINGKKCYIKVDEGGPWFDVPASILGQIDVLIFLTRDKSTRILSPFLVSTQDFRATAENLNAPIDGSYNINIPLGLKWPHIEMRISLGDNYSVAPAPSAGCIDDPRMTVVFDTFELLENESDPPNITEAFRQVEYTIKRRD
ncbi:MAG: hypothetical protein ACE5F7_06480 [Nitrospiria bacterium]